MASPQYTGSSPAFPKQLFLFSLPDTHFLSSLKEEVYGAGQRRGTLRKNQDLDTHPHSSPKEGVLCRSTGSCAGGREPAGPG